MKIKLEIKAKGRLIIDFIIFYDFLWIKMLLIIHLPIKIKKVWKL